ncbi:MAG: hypothetical protein CL625_05935 [Arenimonas sp.]|nr:hypothetical protein [Arenimonas sp.]|tara:strand:- start:18561 stop:18815 length:255 start_codon:yes stop_codon:yes gene_type:complete
MFTLDQIIEIAKNSEASITDRRLLDAFISGLVAANDKEILLSLLAIAGLATWASELIQGALSMLTLRVQPSTDASAGKPAGLKR